MENTINEGAKKKNRTSIILIIIAIAIVAFIIIYFAFLKDVLNKTYDAVFLDNNEVYFGKISSQGGNYIKLKDVYYLRVTYTTKTDDKGQQYQEPNYQIVKMGTEMHGPKDIMDITREHVLFLQPLAKDSQVLAVIDAYKKNSQLPSVPQAGNQTQGQTQPQTQQPTTQLPGTYGVEQPSTGTNTQK